MAYQTSAVMGIKQAGQPACFNPPMDTLIQRRTVLFALTRDDDTLIVSGLETIPRGRIRHPTARAGTHPKPEKCLILGWNRFAQLPFFAELNDYVIKGFLRLWLSLTRPSPPWLANVEHVIKE